MNFRPSGTISSKNQLQAKLEYPRPPIAEAWVSGVNIRCISDCAEGGAINLHIGQTEVRMIEDIEELCAELQRNSFIDPRVLVNREVEHIKARPDDDVPSSVAETACCRDLPSGCVAGSTSASPGAISI